MRAEAMGPCLAVVVLPTAMVFERYVKWVLSPALETGQIGVIDNLSAHKGKRVKEIIEKRGCKLLYLPPYTPDFNPLEEAFPKVKGLLPKPSARKREALVDGIGTALAAVGAQDARGFFEHCGYYRSAQLLWNTL